MEEVSKSISTLEFFTPAIEALVIFVLAYAAHCLSQKKYPDTSKLPIKISGRKR